MLDVHIGRVQPIREYHEVQRLAPRTGRDNGVESEKESGIPDFLRARVFRAA